MKLLRRDFLSGRGRVRLSLKVRFHGIGRGITRCDGTHEESGFDGIANGEHTVHNALVSLRSQPGAELCHIARQVGQIRAFADSDNDLVARNQAAVFGDDAFLGDFLGHDRPDNLTAEPLDVINFLLESGGFLHVDADNLLGAHLVGTGGAVHAGIAAADDDHIVLDLGLAPAVDVLHEIDAGHDALVPRPVEDTGNMTAGRADHSIIFLAQGFELCSIHAAAVHVLHAHGSDAIDFLLEEFGIQAFPWDNLLHFTAHDRLGLVDSHAVASAGEAPSSSKAAGAAADDSDFLSCLHDGFGKRNILGFKPKRTNQDREIQFPAGTGLHTEVGADSAADAARKRRVVENLTERLLGLAGAKQVVAELGRDAGRTGVLTGGLEDVVLPFRNAQTVLAMGHEPHMLPGVRKNVRENTAGNPFVLMEIFHGKTGESRSLLEGKRHNLAPLLPY